jgi:hypothetical protein
MRRCLLSLLLFSPLLAEENPFTNAKPRMFLQAEYLYFWLKEAPAPPLLVTEDESALLGGTPLHTGPQSGARFSLTYKFGSSRFFGLDANYLFLKKNSYSKSVSSDGDLGSSHLTIPYFNIVTFQESETNLSLPGRFSGQATLKVTNELQEAEANGTFKLLPRRLPVDLQLLTGFLWWDFEEKLTFTTNSPSITPPLDTFYTKDEFKTSNEFYGGQVGLKGEAFWNRLSLQLKGEAAFGLMCSELRINGMLITNDFNGLQEAETFPAGYFALPSNIGRFKRQYFSIIPQGVARLYFHITRCLSLDIGYTFLYVTKTLWATNNLDSLINPSQAPAISGNPSITLVGPAFPEPLFETSAFWMQGLTLGLQLRF